ncbi:MAG: hypothetical protein ACKPE3_14830 [Sphaerospermopsis kisseleviana]
MGNGHWVIHPPSHQSPVTNPQSPVTSHQSPIPNHQSPITNHQSSKLGKSPHIKTGTFTLAGTILDPGRYRCRIGFDPKYHYGIFILPGKC